MSPFRRIKTLPLTLSLCLAAALACPLAGKAQHTPDAHPLQEEKNRILILTDIGNEPDDSQSLVRFLVYSNEFDVEGIVATTSTWLRDKVNTDMILKRIDAYEQVLPNLRKHAQGYPSAQALRDVVLPGRAGYGMDYVGAGKSTPASALIIQSVDKQDVRPLWIAVWGGAVDLAQALYDVRASRSPEEVKVFLKKLRVYAISDQDNTGVWIRQQFPELRYITSIHAWNDYFIATWSGMSSRFAEGGDMSQVNNDWLSQNIRNKGPLGAVYPAIEYTMEGDTPSLLYLLQNGINAPEHPEYGGWGGRYAAITPDSDNGLRTSTSDTVTCVDGKTHRTAAATIWRWRADFQNDFAARMAWTITDDVTHANHNPHMVLNGRPGKDIVTLQVKAGDVVKLSAQGSTDPDGDRLSYRWWQYKEPTATTMGIHFAPALTLSNDAAEQIEFTAPAVKAPTPFHVILQGQDDGAPSLVSYRRAIITVLP